MREIGHLEELVVDGRTISNWSFQKVGLRASAGMICLGTGAGDRRL